MVSRLKNGDSKECQERDYLNSRKTDTYVPKALNEPASLTDPYAGMDRIRELIKRRKEINADSFGS